MDNQKLETRINFVEYLQKDASFHIMSFLDDPADLVRISTVSRRWRRFVIENEVAKQLCYKTFPQLSSIVRIVNATEDTINSVGIKTNPTTEREVLERDHKVYASLHQAITKSKVSPMDCIANAVSASSTDRYPDESVVNTLNPRDRFIHRASYWSSAGQSNPGVPETLIYKLRTGIWVLTEIDIQPFEAFWETGRPIYSAKSVRFRMGHLKSPGERRSDLQNLPLRKPADDKFVWTYTSPEFPMRQENLLQPFKLPEPVLCIGGYLQIELLGRVQREEIDGLYYICVCFVRVLGRPLFPAFDMEVVEGDGKVLLKYHPENLNCILRNSSSNEVPHLRYLEEEILRERILLLDRIQQALNNPFAMDYDDDGDNNEEENHHHQNN